MNKSKFEQFIELVPFSGCWIWMKSLSPKGYGKIHHSGQTRAHRVSWLLYRGPIPENVLVLHTCDVRCCVNPEHLYLGTNGDNMRDRQFRGPPPYCHPPKEFCKRGHPLQGTNLYTWNGKRYCRTCQNSWHKRQLYVSGE